MERYIGIDVGSRQIGIALSDEGGTIASPHSTVEVSEPPEAIATIVDLIRDRDVATAVIGWPLRMDGSEGRAIEGVRAFITDLEAAVDEEELEVEIVRWDERMTTTGAESALLEADLSRERRREVVDRVAAARILQSYLDSL